jgi:BirA family biotin operon repressor/biotin-[acetyl-CoA-carboxylase] ligase
MNVIFLNNTESTQVYARNLVQTTQINQPTVIYTGNQTNGIGRSEEKSWQMKSESAIAMSVVFKVNSDVSLPYSMIAAYFISTFYLTNYKINIEVKWPNDLYLNGKKIGGIITNIEKNQYGDLYCIIGIGINLSDSPELNDKISGYNASNILKETCIFIKYDEDIKRLAEEISGKDFKKISPNIMKLLDKKLYMIGSSAIINEISGTFLGIDENGSAKIQSENGEISYITSGSLKFL